MKHRILLILIAYICHWTVCDLNEKNCKPKEQGSTDDLIDAFVKFKDEATLIHYSCGDENEKEIPSR